MAERYVKICGLRTPDMVAEAVDAGADAIGFVFAPGSARTVDAATVRDLVAAVPDTVETVAVFRNQPLAVVLETARAAGVSTVQLHGDESLEDIRQVQAAGFRTLRAFSAQAFGAMPATERAKWAGERILLDAVEPGAGQAFDASVLEGRAPEGFWLLAGGLTPSNVGALLEGSGAGGADVSSGVESSRGTKDAGLVRAFILAARAPGA
ncbi:phosphoribosylanthranilate isomerase [Arthrobacter sp. JSM 101049]|uniref:phosphoribosylanthranilate isomerase n=1 Tax=Arthrobacter sp. JSM 101049 TaxID=929097 RepID=UPI0035668867